MICWDQWFPESSTINDIGRSTGTNLSLLQLAGIQKMMIIEQQRQFQAWQTIQQSHAIANNLPLISTNRVGHEKDPSRTI